jgi:hypothetical protein
MIKSKAFIILLPFCLAGCDAAELTGYDCDNLRAEVVAIPDSKLIKIYDPILVKRSDKLVECKGNGAFTDNTNYPLTYKAEIDKEGDWMVSFDASEAINAEAQEQQAQIEQQVATETAKLQKEIEAEIQKAQAAAEVAIEEAQQGIDNF